MNDLLDMTGIVKTFPGVRALGGVDLRISAGEVHCLLGQNGAGKSTLIKVLSGAHAPDAGRIRWCGQEVRLPSPVAALRLGIATMYQELDLVPGLSVADNVFLGHELAAAGFTRRGRANREARALLARLGHPEIDPETEVGELPAAARQLVSMARALAHRAKLIVMDEPTAALSAEEVDNLFRIIAELTAEGVAVVYISHRMEEIRRIADRVTVLKDGRTTASGLPVAVTSTAELVALMTGRAGQDFPERPAASTSSKVVLEVDGLARRGEFEPVSFTVAAGEIVGLAGLVGCGRSELLETIFGARTPTSGRVRVAGRPVRPGSVAAAVAAGIGLTPEERKSQALLPQLPVAANITLSALSRYSRFGFTRRGKEVSDAREIAEQLQLRPADPLRPIGTLSGGNQQKAVVGRWVLRGCRVLLLDEPTRGVDVGARAELYGLMRRLAAEGLAIVLVSSEVPEVLAVADRVLVLRDGAVVHTAEAGRLTESDVLDLVMEAPAR
ncbi:monosaccharide ABC transporter ATP-binding protein (CUT2 family) [Saccharopolyspora erythraea NRRL 2338]|uniref:ABC transporter protein, ATP binding component n=3 Tax=Saccharopolyspora erythraea TaxID=1836 RepID=A4FDZ0_SACEN|nr:monosaccharide ABC transporter ATP-binding protein (CUT2 family) [Saccharopolyspora erythraea NRRL 2338]CAM02265.1 ABC transporter protein, ATP binding component [Saccharopolyspora erythraea NRRL 2338]